MKNSPALFNDVGCGTPFGCEFGPEFQCTQLALRYAYYAWGEPANWGAGAAYGMWTTGPNLPIPLQQFANGAVRAARFLNGKPPGLYTMADVLGS